MSKTPFTVVTSDARAKWLHDTLLGVRNKFAMGDIRSAIIITAGADGEAGGNYHIETASDKAILLEHLEKMVAEIKDREINPTPTSLDGATGL